MKITTRYEIQPLRNDPKRAQLIVYVSINDVEVHSFVPMSDTIEAIEEFVANGVLPSWVGGRTLAELV